jgi:hypothetical protein
LLCITLFFTSCHRYNIVVYFTKKNAFQSTKNFRRIQWQNMLRMASECISCNLEFQKPLWLSPLEPAALSLCLRQSNLPLLSKLRLLLQFFLRTLCIEQITVYKGQFHFLHLMNNAYNLKLYIKVGCS